MKTGRPYTAPAHCDIFGYLRTLPRGAELSEIVKRVGYSEHRSMIALREMHSLGIIHIRGWRKCARGGYPAKRWACWPGKDAQMPPLVSRKESRLKWYHGKIARMTNLYGPDVARRMVYSRACGGASKIVIDGKTVFQRQEKAGRPKEIRA